MRSLSVLFPTVKEQTSATKHKAVRCYSPPNLACSELVPLGPAAFGPPPRAILDFFKGVQRQGYSTGDLRRGRAKVLSAAIKP